MARGIQSAGRGVDIVGRAVTVGPSGGGGLTDSADLYAHYDASDKTDVSTTWSAEVGPDLSADGNPSVLTSEKNGLNAVRYDGSGDGHQSSFASTQAQPNHVFIVYQLPTAPGGSEYIIASPTEADSHEFATANGGADMAMQTRGTGSNSKVVGPATDTNWHIASLLFNEGSSVYRQDGSQVASGSLGSQSWSGIVFGWLPWNNGNYIQVSIGEVAFYPMDKSSVQDQIESDLNEKWNVY